MKKIIHLFFIIVCVCLLISPASDMLPKASAASLTASDSCVDFIKKVEGFSARPYYDYKQHTVGYGTKCPTDKYLEYYTNGIPKEDAEALLLEALDDIAEAIHNKLIYPYNLTFTQHQFDALVSFSFNVGTAWMTYDSSLRNALLNDSSDDQMVYAFSLFSTAGGTYLSGLINRRLCEANMFLNGVYSSNASEDFGYVLYEPNGGSLTYQVQGFVCQENPSPIAEAVRRGDVFLGWYTDIAGGSHVTELNRDLSGKTLFARWKSSEDSEEHDSSSMVITVTGDVVNIRKGPGTNYGFSKQVYQNDVFVVSHVTQLFGRKWGKVDEGWICLEYTNYEDLINGTGNPDSENSESSSSESTVPEDPPEPTEEEADSERYPDVRETISGTVCVNDLLRIRSGPGTIHSTVGYLVNGSSVKILELRTDGEMVWGRIARGWVSMDYISTDEFSTDLEEDDDSEEDASLEDDDPEEIIPPATVHGRVIADALRARSGPGTEYPIIGFYYQNDTVTISEFTTVDSAQWGKTGKGWINLDYILMDSSSNEESAAEDTGRKTVIADCLRVRKDTTTDSRIAALLYYGDRVTVLETKTVNDTLWGRIEQGWICMDYVE